MWTWRNRYSWEHQFTVENINSQLTVTKSPGSGEGIIRDWIPPSMTLISHHIETHGESSLHLFPTKKKKLVFSTEKSIWIDNHQKTVAEEPQQNPACVITEDLLFEHIFSSEHCSTTLDWFLQHSKNNTFSISLACFDDLLIYSTGFLKHLGHTDMTPNYLMETGLKLKVPNWHFIQ